jgi:hypothetical protein
MRLPHLTQTNYFFTYVEPFLHLEQAFAKVGLQLENYAVTECDLATGAVTTTQLNRQAYGSPVGCLDAHENTHIHYQSSCCAKAKKCFDKTTDNSCVNRFRRWHQSTLDHNECQAYTNEVACLETALLRNPPYSQGTIRNINTRLGEARGLRNRHCPGVVEACPFNNNGDIIS